MSIWKCDPIRRTPCGIRSVGISHQRPRLSRLERELHRTNESLWDVEDEIRLKEKKEDFGPELVEIARRVYQTNDRRCALKRRVDELLGSGMIDQRAYAVDEEVAAK